MTTGGKVKLTSAIILVALIVYVFWLNREPVEFDFIFFGAKVAKTLLILGSMILGAVVTLVVQLFWRQRKRLRAAQHSQISTPR